MTNSLPLNFAANRSIWFWANGSKAAKQGPKAKADPKYPKEHWGENPFYNNVVVSSVFADHRFPFNCVQEVPGALGASYPKAHAVKIVLDFLDKATKYRVFKHPDHPSHGFVRHIRDPRLIKRKNGATLYKRLKDRGFHVYQPCYHSLITATENALKIDRLENFDGTEVETDGYELYDPLVTTWMTRRIADNDICNPQPADGLIDISECKRRLFAALNGMASKKTYEADLKRTDEPGIVHPNEAFWFTDRSMTAALYSKTCENIAKLGVYQRQKRPPLPIRTNNQEAA